MSDTVEGVVDLVARSSVRAVTVVSPGLRVTVRKPKRPPRQEEELGPSGQTRTCDAAAPQVEVARPEAVIRSQRVGIFHHLEPQAGVGLAVQPGQTVGVIESMKLPSEVRSHCTGVIAQVLIEDGVPVEFDQPLFVLAVRPGPSREVEE